LRLCGENRESEENRKKSKTMKHAEWVCQRKRAWSTRVKAEVHALGVMNHPVRKMRAKVPIYVYQCDVCGKWHLTKRPRPEEW
jgi:NMD protein affecting ribosome stability and mRNA decay